MERPTFIDTKQGRGIKDSASKCPTHDKFPVYKACNCRMKWDSTASPRKLIHKGSHEHRRPPLKKPTPSSKNQLNQISVLSSDRPLEVMVGNSTRTPAYEIDPALSNLNRLQYLMRRARGPYKLMSAESWLNFLGESESRKRTIVSSKIEPTGHITIMPPYLRNLILEETEFHSDTAERFGDYRVQITSSSVRSSLHERDF